MFALLEDLRPLLLHHLPHNLRRMVMPRPHPPAPDVAFVAAAPSILFFHAPTLSTGNVHPQRGRLRYPIDGKNAHVGCALNAS
eukprot:CAMPEP_0183770008 /NCGR_PEP_ID=MMETSP0739-20130205/25067_1 /TAXON_ID=385413 /ORGANISM="Thalassiosira miniscula, Strain CCMP1093" /LENGTH=82 /DNA_ID=CAMNT_0026009807 /DNA_START=32 /DNA_END=277 /DNA_ORIENTATION=-